MLPLRSWYTCAAVVGEGLVDRFAEGAAIGVSLSAMRALATGSEGIRTANVGWPAVVNLESVCECTFVVVVVGRRIVSGPGQSCFIRE